MTANWLERVRVVLLRPRWATNLGAVARAMKNFGLADLRLVDSRIGSWADAHRMAVHADDVLERARSVATFAEAVEDATLVVGSTNRPPAGMRVLSPREVAAAAAAHGSLALVCGDEEHGMEVDELLRCHAVGVIPTAAAQSSLNLAQAVCVFAAELWAAAAAPAERPDAARSSAPDSAPSAAQREPATAEMMARLADKLRDLLEGSAWARADRSTRAIEELMQPLWRARLDEAEVRQWLVALHKAKQR